MNATNRSWEAARSPSVSIVMIGHRRADLLSRAIESVATHSRGAPWEMVLIINGGGAGKSRSVDELATSLLAAERFPLAVVRIPECRPGAARNFGVKVARAPLLFFLDDD